MRISDWSSDGCSSDLVASVSAVAASDTRDGRPEWPENVAVQPSKPQMNVQSGEMKAVWVGHATVLVQAGGLNILTDPIWSDYASPFPPLGPERVTKPGIRFEDLPKRSEERRVGKEGVRTCGSGWWP